MPAATVTAHATTRAGGEVSYTTAPAVGPHTVENSGNMMLHVVAPAGDAVSVTLDTPVMVGGFNVANPVVNVPAGGERFIGPFNPALFNNSEGQISFTLGGNGRATSKFAAIAVGDG